LIENEASNTRFEIRLARARALVALPAPGGRNSCFLFQREQPGSASHPLNHGFQFSVFSFKQRQLASTEN
jgi:hypothetical protein